MAHTCSMLHYGRVCGSQTSAGTTCLFGKNNKKQCRQTFCKWTKLGTLWGKWGTQSLLACLVGHIQRGKLGWFSVSRAMEHCLRPVLIRIGSITVGEDKWQHMTGSDDIREMDIRCMQLVTCSGTASPPWRAQAPSGTGRRRAAMTLPSAAPPACPKCTASKRTGRGRLPGGPVDSCPGSGC